jgi:hypothetical protein
MSKFERLELSFLANKMIDARLDNNAYAVGEVIDKLHSINSSLSVESGITDGPKPQMKRACNTRL